MPVARGQVWYATFDGLRKPWLVVSNNARNRALPSCLGVRITSREKPPLESIVELSEADAPVYGRVLCDEITILFPAEDQFQYHGTLTPETMMRVEAGLRASLAMR